MNLRLTSGATVYTCNYLVTGGSGSVVLPVTISAFDVVKTNGKQCLAWKVEDESDIQFYTVQYSSNGVDYNDIEKVTATNNNQPHNYSYCDVLEKTTGLYRLKINEQSGRINYSYTVRITQKQTVAFALYPVPASDIIYVESVLDLKNTIYTIINVNGQKQKTGRFSIARSADIHDLPSGIYFMRIQAGGQTHTIQFEKK
jgi:Secretion system C-terminal sorting domain